MDLDIRLPIGALFLAIGAILAGEGLAGHPKTLAGVSAGLNIDLIWGAAMAAFGLVMLMLAAWARRRR
jgi:hypothetical protein